jgi:ACT domain-containing protein
MITNEQKEKLLEELRRHSIVDFACKKSGISRATYYRLFKSSSRFRKLALNAKMEGIEVNNDAAESVIINAIRGKDMSASKYWLEHNHPRYKKKDRKQETAIKLQDTGLAGLLKKTLRNARKKKEKQQRKI